MSVNARYSTYSLKFFMFVNMEKCRQKPLHVPWSTILSLSVDVQNVKTSQEMPEISIGEEDWCLPVVNIAYFLWNYWLGGATALTHYIWSTQEISRVSDLAVEDLRLLHMLQTKCQWFTSHLGWVTIALFLSRRSKHYKKYILEGGADNQWTS